MSRILLVLGGLCLLVGLVWTFQGVGVIRGSFMTGSRFWLVVGLVLDAGGVYLLYRGVAQQPRSR